MAGILVYSEIVNIALDRCQANVSTDAPFGTAEILRHANEAYADVYAISGGGKTTIQGGTLWSTNQPTAGGVVTCVASATDLLIEDFLHVFAMDNNTDVPGETSDWQEMERADLSTIQQLNGALSGLGTYAGPKLYCIVRRSQSPAAETVANRYDLYFHPYVAGYYFPAIVTLQFDPFDGGASDVPNVTDMESRDIPLLMAARMAPLIDNAELVPSILMDISQRTRQGLEAKALALLDSKQDR